MNLSYKGKNSFVLKAKGKFLRLDICLNKQFSLTMYKQIKIM